MTDAPRSTVTPRTALLAVLCMLLWSGAYVGGKIAIGTPDAPGFGPFRLAFFRFAVAGMLLFLWQWTRDRNALRVRREDSGAFFRVGLLGICLTYVFNYGGLALTSGTAGALIMASEPVWIAVLAVIFLKERMTLPRLVGIFFGLSGAIIVVRSTSGGASAGNTTLFGNALLMVSLLFEAGAVLTVKSLTKRYSGAVIVIYEFLIGAVLLAPVAAWETATSGTLHPTGAAWAAFAYLLVACTLVAYPIWFRLLETTDASDLTLFIFLQPVIGAVIGVVVLHEPFTVWTTVGAALVLFGVWNLTARGAAKRNAGDILSSETQ